MKKMFCLMMSVIMMLSFSVFVSATDLSTAELESLAVVAEKRELRATHYNEDITAALAEKNISIAERNTLVSELMQSLLINEATEEKQTEILDELESLGVYALESSVESFNSMQTRSAPSSLDWRSVIITYDSVTDTWMLGAGGNWTDDSWADDVWDYVVSNPGATKDVGGFDGIGIRLYNTFGNYYPTTLVDSYAYITDGDGRSFTSESRVAGINPSNGVFFQYQDYIYCVTAVGPDNWTYIGKHFAVMATYSGDFADYHGYAEVQFVHTWNNATISSVTVGVEETPSFSITISNEENSFTATSSDETIF